MAEADSSQYSCGMLRIQKWVPIFCDQFLTLKTLLTLISSAFTGLYGFQGLIGALLVWVNFSCGAGTNNECVKLRDAYLVVFIDYVPMSGLNMGLVRVERV